MPKAARATTLTARPRRARGGARSHQPNRAATSRLWAGAGPSAPSAPSTTTTQAKTAAAEQHTKRRVNLLGEYTQSAIAVIVTVAAILVPVVTGQPSELLSNAFFLVVGFYFGARTNQERVGLKTRR